MASRTLSAVLSILAALACRCPAGVSGDLVRVLDCGEHRRPVVDGRLDDAVWADGQWTGGLVLLTRNDTDGDPPTELKLATDGEELFLAARMAEPSSAGLRARQPMGGDLWKDDSIELFLDACPNDPAYHQVIVNSVGNWVALKHLSPGGPRLKQWGPAIRAAASVTAEAWHAEMALPLCSLGSVAGTGEWRFNIVRNRTQGGQVHTLARTTAVHQPARFLPLVLPAGITARHSWTLGTPLAASTRREDGRLWWEASIPVENATDVFRFFTLRAQLVRGSTALGGGSSHGGQDAGLRRAYSLRIPAPDAGKALLRVQVVDRVETDLLYQSDVFPVEIAYQPVKLALLQPAYRNSVYSSYPLPCVRLRLDFDLEEDLLASGRVSVRALDPEQREIDLARVPKPESGVEVTLLQDRLMELPPGAYTVEARLTAEREHTASVPLTVHPPCKREVVVDQAGGLRIDGKPFLPVGWFTPYPKDYDEYAGEGYSFLTDYNAPFRSLQEQREQYLDEAAKRNLMTMVYPWPRKLHYAPYSKFVREQEGEALAMIRERVEAWRYHPSLLAWYMADEPGADPETVRVLRRIYETVRAADPYHPCVILSDKPDKAEAHAANGDILVADPYPGFIRGGNSARAIGVVGEDTRTWQRFAGLKPVWITPQGHDLAVYGQAGHRAPDFREVRNMAYQAACAGAKGWLWFRWVFGRHWPAVKVGTSYVGRELLALGRFHLAPESPRAGRVTVEGGADVCWSLREAGQELLLMVVNTRYEPVEFAIAGLPGTGRLRVVSEDRTIECGGGRLSDRLPPAGVRLYTTAPLFDGERGLSSVQAEIEAAVAARGVPGNLAWVGHGVRARGSSPSAYYAIDGCRKGYSFRVDDRSGATQPPYWLELVFTDPVTVARAVLYGSTMEADLQVEADGGWLETAVVRVQEGKGEARFTPVRTTKVRVETRDNLVLSEIELYGLEGKAR